MAQILIVDGQSDTAASIGRQLRRAGHTVHADSQPHTALRAAAQRIFDVAIVDAALPGSGVDFLRQLRAVQPSCARILSADHSDETSTQAYQQGTITRVLSRPFSTEGLFAALDAALRFQQNVADLARLQRAAAEEEERVLLDEFFSQQHLDLAFQPIVWSSTERTIALEALLRSRHPVLRSPLAVLQAAERFEAIGTLADAVAQQAAAWLERLAAPSKLFINVHPEELSVLSLLEDRLAMLPPERVVLELTELRRLPDVLGWERSIARVQDLGFAISIDDFADNASAMSLISTLMPAYMRLDMSVTRGVDADPTRRRLVEMMGRFADACGAQLIAEGVETREEAQALIDAGVSMMQGYLFGRPSTEPEVVQRWVSGQTVISAA